MLRRLTLVGYRASGKSTAGRMAAERLAWSFVDADRWLEARIGPIPAYFAAHGEAAFREREAEALAELLARPDALVLATGGGVVLRADNRARLCAEGGLVAYLEAPATVLQARLRRDAGGRPSLTGRSVADEVPDLLAQRDPLYREVAGHVLDASRPAPQVANDLAHLIEQAVRPKRRQSGTDADS
jgi:shikimate kinase